MTRTTASIATNAEDAMAGPGEHRVRISALTVIRESDDGAVYRGQFHGPDIDRSVIVKLMRSGEGSVRERAALELARDHDLPGVVRLLGASDRAPLVVIEDLGTGPSLADRFLADDPEAATAALLRWIDAIADLQSASRDLRPAFVQRMQQLAPRDTPDADYGATTAEDSIAQLRANLPLLDLRLPNAAAAELRDAAATLMDLRDGTAPIGLVPGDTCPDNNLDLTTGTTLFDFEGAQFRHAAWEMAYLTAPWPTCWCGWSIPEVVVATGLERWRRRLAEAFPAVLDPDFDADLERATVLWSARRAAQELGAALRGEPERPRTVEGVAPARHASVQHRLGVLAAAGGAVAPALAAVAAAAHARTIELWRHVPLPIAPAWR